MQRSDFGQTVPCVLIDLNTQHDFFDAGGACPVLDVPGVYRCLRRVVAWVKRNQVPVISTLDLHRGVELDHRTVPVRCVEGTRGQTKLDFTLLPNRVFIAGDNMLSVPIDLFGRHQQVIFPQRSRDIFANPKADRFITQLNAAEFIVAGAVAEHEVKAVVLGLLARNKRATIVSDVCGAWNHSEMDLSLRQMAAKGAVVITAEELLRRKLPRCWRYTSSTVVSAHRPFGLDAVVRRNGVNGSNGHRRIDLGIQGHNGSGQNGQTHQHRAS